MHARDSNKITLKDFNKIVHALEKEETLKLNSFVS